MNRILDDGSRRQVAQVVQVVEDAIDAVAWAFHQVPGGVHGRPPVLPGRGRSGG